MCIWLWLIEFVVVFGLRIASEALLVVFVMSLRLFIEAIPVAVLGILITIHVLLFIWKCVRSCTRKPITYRPISFVVVLELSVSLVLRAPGL